MEKETKREKGKRRCHIRYLLLAGMILLSSGCGKKEPDWEKHIIEEEIIIESLSGEYELLFLTDSHVVIMDENDPAQTKEYTASRYSMFHNGEGISSAEQFSGYIDYVNEEDMDGLLLGGDIIDCPSEGILDYLEKELGSLKVPYVYTPGNHDWTFPWEYMTEKGKTEYLSRLQPYMGNDTTLHSYDFGEFIVVSVDNSKGQVNAEALARYKEILEEGKPVIVLVHVPFLTQSVLTKARQVWNNGVVIGGGNYGGIYPDKISEEFVQLTAAEDSPVAAVLAGHVHFYDKDVIDGERDVVQIVGDAGFHGSAVHLTIKGKDSAAR